MPVPKNGVYKVIKFPRIGPIALRTPSFPSACPQCGKLRKPITREEQRKDPSYRTATYECEGMYGPLATRDPDYNFFGGRCGLPQSSPSAVAKE